MKIFERIVLIAGFATLAALVIKLNPSVVAHDIMTVGWGFLLILPFPVFDNIFNSIAWRFSFSRHEAKGLPFLALFRGRVAGDGVNYLTPSGTIAGEFVRPGMLGDIRTAEVKNASVIVAKLSQSLAQALFILIGLFFVIDGPLHFLNGRSRHLATGWALLVGTIILGSVAFLAMKPAPGKRPWQAQGRFAALRAVIRGYLLDHPVRLTASILFFGLGYLWGAAEVLLITRFMGLSLPLETALAVEVLSNILDSLMFMVPAKVGTQEAGKTAIFYWLGYPASQGLAFGLIRHLREILWAAAGFLLYAVNRRSLPSAAAPPRALSELLREPL
jgi:hypothetical protein